MLPDFRRTYESWAPEIAAAVVAVPGRPPRLHLSATPRAAGVSRSIQRSSTMLAPSPPWRGGQVPSARRKATRRGGRARACAGRPCRDRERRRRRSRRTARRGPCTRRSRPAPRRRSGRGRRWSVSASRGSARDRRWRRRGLAAPALRPAVRCAARRLARRVFGGPSSSAVTSMVIAPTLTLARPRPSGGSITTPSAFSRWTKTRAPATSADRSGAGFAGAGRRASASAAIRSSSARPASAARALRPAARRAPPAPAPRASQQRTERKATETGTRSLDSCIRKCDRQRIRAPEAGVAEARRL